MSLNGRAFRAAQNELEMEGPLEKHIMSLNGRAFRVAQNELKCKDF